MDEGAARSGFGSEIPTAKSGNEGEADAVGGIEGAQGFGLGEKIEERGGLIERDFKRLPAEARGAGDERAAFEQVLNARRLDGDGGDVFDELKKGHVSSDDGREGDGFSGFAADFHADGRGGAHDMTLQ